MQQQGSLGHIHYWQSINKGAGAEGNDKIMDQMRIIVFIAQINKYVRKDLMQMFIKGTLLVLAVTLNRLQVREIATA